MISDHKPYAEYKDSGSCWLAQVPTHWEVRNLRTLIRPRNERNRIDLPLLSVARERGVFVRSMTDAKENHNVIPEDLTNYKVARAGSLVINKMKAWQGSMGIAPSDGIVSPAYYVFDFDIASRAFGQFLLRSKPYVAHFGHASDGVRVGQWDLTIAAMRQIPVLVPPPEEQSAIVCFLNYATHRLDKAIRAKRKTIALLNEQKQVIIHRAVTRGLNPDVPLKDSGIPWLGQIPAHWELRRFKFLASINNGQVDPKKATFKNLPLIAPNHIKSGTGVLLFQQTADEQGADSGKFLVRPGQVIYSKIRPNLRKATIAPVECLCSADMYPITVKTDLLSAEYLLVLLLSQPFTKFAVDCSMRVAMPKINREALANCLLWLPLLDEQSKILEFIKRESAPFESANLRLEREIELLREYRTRLIADVVTGKLDVREAATHLPEMECTPAAEPELAEMEESGEELAEEDA